MAKKPVTKSPKDDARFEAFLQKQFAELKREIDQQAGKTTARKEGKVLQLGSGWKKNKGGWMYGIAAAVLVAVTVPSVIQLNHQQSLANSQQKTELSRNTETPKSGEDKQYYKDRSGAPAAASPDAKAMGRAETEKESEESSAPAERTAAFSQKKKAAAKGERKIARMQDEKDAAPATEATVPTDALAANEKNLQAGDREAAGRMSNAVREGESAKLAAGSSAETDNDKAPSGGYRAAKSAPASVPAAPAAPRSTDSRADESKADTFAATKEEFPRPAQRSLSVDDGASRLKKQSIAEEEKAEMEKLWKEFEKDPKSFNKDQRRSARLRTLLSRHNEKSRAKRMRSVETQKAY